MAEGQMIATVLVVNGDVFARNENGEVRRLQAGDQLHEGEVVISSDQGSAQLAVIDGEMLQVEPSQSFSLNLELAASTAPQADDVALASADVDPLIEAILSGEEFESQLEATAAGVSGGGGADEGNSFVRLLRIAENVDPDGFPQDNGSSVNGPDQQQSSDTFVLGGVEAAPDTAVTFEEQPVLINVLANDTPPSAGELTLDSFTDPSNGSVVIDPDSGLPEYTPDPDFVGEDSFDYTVSGPDGSTSTTTVTVIVNPGNDAPVANPDLRQTNEDAGSLVGNVITAPVAAEQADSDPDGDALTVVAVGRDGVDGNVGSALAGEHGVLTLNPDGSYSYALNPELQELDDGEVVEDVFNYSISDGSEEASSTLTITISGSNDGPIANPDVRAASQDTSALSGNVISAPNPGEQADFDVDGDALSVTGFAFGSNTAAAGNALVGAFGTLTLNADGSYNYVLSPAAQALSDDDSVTDVFVYTITDGDENDTTTLTIRINGSNDGPIAVADSGTTPEDTPLLVPVLNNDSDPDGDPLSVIAVNGTPINSGSSIDVGPGQVTLDSGGGLLFTPDPDYVGPVNFDYTISDGQDTDSATVTITVTPVNDPPDAVNDVRSTAEDTPVTIAVLNNDSDPDGDPLTVVAINGQGISVGGSVVTANGTVTLNNNGSLTFDPNPGYNGTAQFDYTISDGQATDTATAIINISAENDPPQARPDQRSVSEDASVSGNVISAPNAGEQADTDPDGDSLVVTAVSFGGSAGAVGSSLSGDFGVLVLNGNGSYSYTPNAAAQSLDDGETGVDVFTYSVSDGAESDSTTLTITVEGSNDGPIARADVRAMGEDDASVSGNVITAPNSGEQQDTDVDGDDLSVTAVAFGATAGTVGSSLAGDYGDLILNADGSYSYEPNDAAQGLDDGETGVDVFTYTISDGSSSDTTTLTINVTGQNDGPVAVDDIGRTPEDTPITIAVLDNDFDVDGDDLSVISVEGQTVTVGSPIDIPEGSVVLTPDGQLTFTPKPNFNGPVAFDYSITDGDETDTATVRITVDDDNDPPVANPDARSVSENAEMIEGNVITAPNAGEQADTDVDGDTLNVSAVSHDGVAGTVGTRLAGEYGDLILNSDGSYRYEPNDAAQALDDGETGVDVFSYTVTDGAASDSTTLTITVEGSNDGPVARPDVRSVGEDDASISGNVITAPNTGEQADTDVDGDDLSVTAVAFDGTDGTVGTRLAGEYGDLILNADGSYSYEPNDAAQGLDDGETGVDVFDYTVSDGDATASTTLTITVEGSNDGPIARLDVRSVGEDDASISGNVITAPNTGEQADTDVDGDDLTVTAVAFDGADGTVGTRLAGDYGDLILNADGSYSYEPNAAAQGLDDGETGVDVFDYTVSDGDATASTTLTITVEGSNDGPIARLDVRSVGEDDASISGNVITAPNTGEQADFDIDGDDLDVTAVSFNGVAGTLGATLAGDYGDLVLNADGSYRYVPNAAAALLNDGETGVDVFDYTISDGDESDSTTLTFRVSGSDDGPIVGQGAANVSEEGLPGGLADSQGNPDTTSDASVNASISLTAPAGDPVLSVGLQPPAGSFSSGGQTVTWSGVGTGTLIGSAGGAPVMTLSLGTDGQYSFTLHAPLDHPNSSQEDGLDLNFGVTASNISGSNSGSITITVEDDAPQALMNEHAMEQTNTNVLIILDVSGSMGNDDGVGGQTRLQSAVQALNALMDRYDDLGGVAVRIVTFASGASAQGSDWTDIATAQAQLAALSASGTTNYDAALDTAQDAFADSGALDGQNVAYFLSDGRPNRPSDSAGINNSEEDEWIDFLEDNAINAFALGLGTGVNDDNLDPIAYDGQIGQNTDALLVTNFDQLESVLVGTVPMPVMGDLLETAMVGADTGGVGADGGYVQSLLIDGTSYSYDPSAGGSISTSGGADNGSFDAATQTLTVETVNGGHFIVDMDDGGYRYEGPDSIDAAVLERMDFTVVDNDGDTSSSAIEVAVSLSSAAATSAKLLSLSDPADAALADGAYLMATPGADVFAWTLADRGSVGAPHEQHIQGFDHRPPAEGGDALHLADLLQGERADNLDDYLHFEVENGGTVVQISSEGGFEQGFNDAAVDQRIVLEGVDLSQGGHLNNDMQIIQDLVNKGNLITD